MSNWRHHPGPIGLSLRDLCHDAGWTRLASIRGYSPPIGRSRMIADVIPHQSRALTGVWRLSASYDGVKGRRNGFRRWRDIGRFCRWGDVMALNVSPHRPSVGLARAQSLQGTCWVTIDALCRDTSEVLVMLWEGLPKIPLIGKLSPSRRHA